MMKSKRFMDRLPHKKGEHGTSTAFEAADKKKAKATADLIQVSSPHIFPSQGENTRSLGQKSSNVLSNANIKGLSKDTIIHSNGYYTPVMGDALARKTQRNRSSVTQ